MREAPADAQAPPSDILDKSRWRPVSDFKEPMAESLLEKALFIRLTQAQTVELAGEFSLPEMGTLKPFLIRAVGSHIGTAGFEIRVGKNGDVMVAGGALSHHDVPPERRTIVVWLDQPPHNLYISFGVAE